jgi:tetratricopeptide (TPR) repeat protein
VLAARGRHAEAEELAREAITLAGATDLLNVQADAYSDLADVLMLGGQADHARIALGQAIGRYEHKGNIVMAERTRTRLAGAEATRTR